MYSVVIDQSLALGPVATPPPGRGGRWQSLPHIGDRALQLLLNGAHPDERVCEGGLGVQSRLAAVAYPVRRLPRHVGGDSQGLATPRTAPNRHIVR